MLKLRFSKPNSDGLDMSSGEMTPESQDSLFTASSSVAERGIASALQAALKPTSPVQEYPRSNWKSVQKTGQTGMLSQNNDNSNVHL